MQEAIFLFVFFVIPACGLRGGIQAEYIDSRLRGNDREDLDNK